jgi:hypothetical protein
MAPRQWLGPWVFLCMAAFHAAAAGEGCDHCRAAALAQQSRCQALAAPDPGLRAKCDATFAEATRACQEGPCKAELESMAAAQCSDCLRQAEAETRKCASLAPAVRGACEARALGLKKACDDKLCPVLKVK